MTAWLGLIVQPAPAADLFVGGAFSQGGLPLEITAIAQEKLRNQNPGIQMRGRESEKVRILTSDPSLPSSFTTML
jgi:hypothetical protein